MNIDIKKILIHILEIGCSGLIGVAVTIGYQHFFSQSHSFTFIIKGEEVVLTESELQNELTKTQDQLTFTQNELNTTQNSLSAAQDELTELKQTLSLKEDELISLNNQLNIAEINKSIIERAKSFADSNDFFNALNILHSASNKTSEINMYINDYTTQYELSIIDQINNLSQENKLDEANIIVIDALKIIPDSQILKDKQQEIEDSFPKNMVDIVPAYESGGNGYKEYSTTKEGATDYFTMAGVKYTNGITFDADINILSDGITWAVYNLNNEYTSLEFVICHVDGTYLGNETSLQIFHDGILKEEIPLKPDMMPKSVSLDVTGVTQLKMQVHESGLDHPLYGLGNPILK